MQKLISEKWPYSADSKKQAPEVESGYFEHRYQCDFSSVKMLVFFSLCSCFVLKYNLV